MEMLPITLYIRPECELCEEARDALRAALADSTFPRSIQEVDIELTEIPAIEYRGALLAHATSRLRIQSFLADVERRV
jgi:hypothetical protein